MPLVTALNVRRIDVDAAARIRRAARAHGLTIGEYRARLSEFHQPHLAEEAEPGAAQALGPRGGAGVTRTVRRPIRVWPWHLLAIAGFALALLAQLGQEWG